MTILDELAALARERHYGHGEREFIERVVCLISRVPVEWCAGCRRGLHRTTRVPVLGAAAEEIVPAEVEPIEVTPVEITPPVIEPPTVALADLVRDPDYCPRCTPLGYGACRCNIASNE